MITTLSDELLSLSRVQILSIMSESRPDKAGVVSYAAFAPVAAGIIYGMIDYDAQKERLAAVAQLSSTAGAEMLKGLTREQVEATMMAAFKAADADDSGTLDRFEMYNVLQMVGTNDLGLDQRQIAVRRCRLTSA